MEQERLEAFFRAHATKEEHEVMVTVDFAAQSLMQVMLERRDRLTQWHEITVADAAESGVLEGNYVTQIFSVADRLHADDVARHGKAYQLIDAALVRHTGFHRPAVQDIQKI